MKVHFFIFTVLLLLVASCKQKKYNEAGLVALDNFGSNPGNLNAYYYEPASALSNSSLLIVLHGCTQNALEIAKETGWNELADEHSFHVLYPEQRTINNATKCFNWFLIDDITKNSGEVASIFQMLDTYIQQKDINPNQVYITGLSAGGAMSMAMISTYPDKFAGAAIMSGGPYKAAENIYESVDALKGLVQKTPQEWGDLVRSQNPSYSGDYAKLCVMHGVNDNVVNYQNALEVIKQWTNVQNIDLQDRSTSIITSDIESITYFDSNNTEKVRLYEITDLGHALAIDPGEGNTQGGTEGGYTKDKDFYSSYWAGKFLGLIN